MNQKIDYNEYTYPGPIWTILAFGLAIGLGILAVDSGDAVMGIGWLCAMAFLVLTLLVFSRVSGKRRENPQWREQVFYQSCCDEGIDSVDALKKKENEYALEQISKKVKIKRNNWTAAYEAGQKCSPSYKAQKKVWSSEEKRLATEVISMCKEIGITEITFENIDALKQHAGKKGRYFFSNERNLIPLMPLVNETFRNQRRREEETLYRLCKENGITELSSANLARLKLLAEKVGIKKTEEEMRAIFQKEQKTEEAERIAQQRKEESSVVEYHEKYMELLGRKKRIQMYLDLASIHQKKSSQYYSEYVKLVQGAVRLGNLTAEKEKDWAIAGGIASGIAGGAAGLATAMNVQMENAQIRERNAANLSAALAMTSGSQEKFHSLSVREESKAEEYTKKAEQAETKLEEMLPQDELFTTLSPVVTSLEDTGTGNKKLVVKYTPQKELTIYENVSAVVDGSIKASIFSKKTAEKLGETVLCLGVDGATASGTMETFFIDISADDQNCYIVLEPYHLWAIEK